jgi:hypothetical protein
MEGDPSMKSYRARLLIAVVSISCFACSAQSAPITPLEQQLCREDYRKFCNEYGLDTPALRACMDRAGRSLSKGCVSALIQAGEVSQGDVDRRK